MPAAGRRTIANGDGAFEPRFAFIANRFRWGYSRRHDRAVFA